MVHGPFLSRRMDTTGAHMDTSSKMVSHSFFIVYCFREDVTVTTIFFVLYFKIIDLTNTAG